MRGKGCAHAHRGSSIADLERGKERKSAGEMNVPHEHIHLEILVEGGG